jgi:hypothetical protein
MLLSVMKEGFDLFEDKKLGVEHVEMLDAFEVAQDVGLEGVVGDPLVDHLQ